MNFQKPISKYSVMQIFFLIWISCSPEEPFSPKAEEEESKVIRHVENITGYETWESNKTHIVATPISIENAVLKIKPGTTIQFEQTASIVVSNSAGFIADGSEQPIIFTGSTAEKGAWDYIYFTDGALEDSCQLINCQLKYGGGNLDRGAAIHCENISPTIIGCTIYSSFSSGINLIGDCRNIKFYDNTIFQKQNL